MGSDRLPLSTEITADYFNPRSPCGERQRIDYIAFRLSAISIHAPRVGSDIRRDAGDKNEKNISIHAPRVGSDLSRVSCRCAATISIHAPRVGSDQAILGGFAAAVIISIHAPRVGSDIG